MIIRSYQTPHRSPVVVPLIPIDGSAKSLARQRDYIWIRPASPSVDRFAQEAMVVRIVPSIAEIQRATASVFDMSLAEMASHRRSTRVAHPRQVAMYLARELTSASLPTIGGRFGGRDHSTVIHAIKQVERRLSAESELRLHIRAICARVARLVEQRDWDLGRGRLG